MTAGRRDEVDERWARRFRTWSLAAAIFAMSVGSLVLVGWLLGIERRMAVPASIVSMKANTAVAVGLLGASVLLDRAGRQRLARVAAAAALAIGAAALVEHIWDLDLGIDELLARDRAPLPGGAPGRPAIVTSIAIVCGGVAVLLLDVAIRDRRPSPWLAAAMAVAGLHGFAGYAYGISALYELAPPTPTALLTALAVIALGLAILLARLERGAASILVSNTIGGDVARRLFPTLAGVMLVLGWLRLLGQDAGLYGTVPGVALHAGANFGVMVVVVWATARRLERVDLDRRRSADEMTGLIEAAPDGIIVSCRDRVTYCNPALEAILGRPSTELVGKELRELVLLSSPGRLDDALDAGGTAAWQRARARRPDGELRLLDLARLQDVHFGGESCALIVLRDVTDRVAVDAQLAAADRLATVGILAAGAGHEINNPLTALHLQLQMLARREGGAAAAAIADAQLCVARIREIVRDLLTLSRPEDDRVGPISLEPVIEMSLRIASNELRPRARVVRDYRSAPRVVGNEARLGQVLLNLIINAAHAIPEGRPDTHFVRVAAATDPTGWAVIEVSDNGSGIEPAVEQRLFEPFFTTKPAGTGLGLSISHRIVTALGGAIEVETETGVGSTFRVRLPPAPPVTG